MLPSQEPYHTSGCFNAKFTDRFYLSVHNTASYHTGPPRAIKNPVASANGMPSLPNHRLYEPDGGDGLFAGKPVNRKNSSIQDCIHSCCLIKQQIDRNLKTMHYRSGLKPVPLSVPLETALIMKSCYDSPGKKKYVTGTNDPTGGFYPNCFTVCFPGFCGQFVCAETGSDDCDFHKGSPSFGSGTDRNYMTLLSTILVNNRIQSFSVPITAC